MIREICSKLTIKTRINFLVKTYISQICILIVFPVREKKIIRLREIKFFQQNLTTKNSADKKIHAKINPLSASVPFI